MGSENARYLAFTSEKKSRTRPTVDEETCLDMYDKLSSTRRSSVIYDEHRGNACSVCVYVLYFDEIRCAQRNSVF